MPFAGGSASDVVTRIMLNEMSKSLGQNFVVENQPGAGGNTGTAAATKAAPDGYTLLMSTSGPLAANRTLFKNLGYDPEKELTPISLFAVLPERHRHQLQAAAEDADRIHRLRQGASQGTQLRLRRRR